jgi:hypothetical protein
MARLYAAARLYVNFFQPSFKLKEKRREGAKVIKRYHPPSTPCARARAHPKVPTAVKQRLREQYRTLDPVTLLVEIRAVQEELGNRIDRRAGDTRGEQRAPNSTELQPMQSSALDAVAFAKMLGTTVEAGELRATRLYKTRVRMPSKLDPHAATIGGWLAAEPQLTALAIVGRLSEKHRERFGLKQHSIVQRLLKRLRKKTPQLARWARSPPRQSPDLHGRGLRASEAYFGYLLWRPTRWPCPNAQARGLQGNPLLPKDGRPVV